MAAFVTPDEDLVQLEIGEKVLQVFKSYNVDCDILTQPAAFSLTMGWGGVAKDLLALAKPGETFRLRVGGNVVQTGILFAPSLHQSGGSTDVTLGGRDLMARLVDSDVAHEQVFKNITYKGIVESALKACNVSGAVIIGSDLANRKAISGGKIELIAPEVDRSGEDIAAINPMKKAVTARCGLTWYHFVKKHLDRAGLFLWVGADGKYILSEPNAKQKPLYRIVKQRNQARNAVSAMVTDFRDDVTHRHAIYVVCGRANGGRKSRQQFQGLYVDEEMFDLGFNNVKAFVDNHSKTHAQAVAMARRKAAEERRQGWNLTYTVKGHTTKSLYGQQVVWTPNTVVEVDDQELGIQGPHWIEGVRFSRGAQGTTTTLKLMRPDDLVFGSDDDELRNLHRAVL